ncbi:glycoside hydrolase family 31 protein [Pedobacter suwonensis]|uniref:glycoside hydrolase family 31 protein n=1 Tax=Pedobacter suwonensis TaxID=332999 RepID=UPI001FCFFF50|nr:TIM-barrel domain-containing protein [Pedobacter suwonensis]
MMKRKFIAVITLLLGYQISVQAQSFQKTPQGIHTVIQSMDVEISFYSPNIVRVFKKPEGSQQKKESLAVIKRPEKLKLDIKNNGQTVTISSSVIAATVNLKTGKVSFDAQNGTKLFTEKDNSTRFTAINDAGNPTYAVKQAYLLDKEEIIYGLGQQQNGKLNQRGQKLLLKQENTKVAIPFFQSVKGYGVFWDNYSPTTFTDNAQETSFDSQVGNFADYYFMFGGGADGVVAQMRALTGQSPMMPLWSFGFSQSRERYKTQFELVDVVKKYRALNIPLDGIVQDWQYWGKDDNWNAMSFDPTIFPKPQAMVDSVHQLNAHLFIVSWPGFAPKTPQYQEFKSKNMLLNFDTWPPGANTKPYDVYNPAARNIYWNYLSKGIFSLGIDAWWLDSTEPDHINVKEQDFDQPTYLGSYRSVENAFPLQHTGGVYDHQRAASSKKRVLLLTRSAFAGQQRYATNTWSGDVGSNWPTLQKQIPAALNFSLSGLPYWNGDIGGFFAGDFVKGGGAKNPDFQELYNRWMQFATFTPLMRSHGTDIPREIYQFGKKGEQAFDIQEKFINLRYRLLPYNYATAWSVTHHAGSFMRPLYSQFPNDPAGFENSSEYMFGRAFLVAPVTDKGMTSKEIYLPSGSKWFDFWTGEVVKGGQTIKRETPMEIVPLYVKAGSIVPWGPKVQYSTEKKWDDLEIRIYPGDNGDFVLYEDENDSYNYEKGAFSEIHFKWNDATKTLTVEDRKGEFKGMLGQRKFNIVMVSRQNGTGIDNQKINKSFMYSGRKLSVKL